jgi:hypothetical protein
MPATRSLVVLAALAVTAASALAGTRSVIVTPTQMGDVNPDARYYLLEQSQPSTGFLHFLLPADFKKNSTATLRLTLFNPGSECLMRFGFVAIDRWRGGLATVSGPPGAMGLSGGSYKDVALAADRVIVKSYEVKGMTTGTIKGQRKGDVVSAMFQRVGDDANDDCGPVFVTSGELRYKTP